MVSWFGSTRIWAQVLDNAWRFISGAMSERLDGACSTRVLGALQHRDKLYLLYRAR